MNAYRAYEDKVRAEVCSRCVDVGEDSKCHSKDPEGCGIFRFLPELVDIAWNLREGKTEDYQRAVREAVCFHCANQDVRGNCAVRLCLDCALDRYLPLVMEALDLIRERERKTA